ncbi:MAG: hypothetical protein J3K34DRAFT_404274 [Monoraphidium minutum]|nr:MAG: hypothetical protein J3K34DRAFT_404274 [Monoraphidium minutum]
MARIALLLFAALVIVGATQCMAQDDQGAAEAALKKKIADLGTEVKAAKAMAARLQEEKVRRRRCRQPEPAAGRAPGRGRPQQRCPGMPGW